MKNIFIQLFNKIWEYVGKLIQLALVAGILIFIYRSTGHQQFIELSNALAWPLTTLTVLIFFRKVIAYLFFSLEEFSFLEQKEI